MKFINNIQTEFDNRGVSPVIGVILMVAITVILAAVIGSFVLGIGGDIEQAPQASLSYSDGEIVHNGGDNLTGESLTVRPSGNGITANAIPRDPGSSNTAPLNGTVQVVHDSSGQIIAELEP